MYIFVVLLITAEAYVFSLAIADIQRMTSNDSYFGMIHHHYAACGTLHSGHRDLKPGSRALAAFLNADACVYVGTRQERSVFNGFVFSAVQSTVLNTTFLYSYSTLLYLTVLLHLLVLVLLHSPHDLLTVHIPGLASLTWLRADLSDNYFRIGPRLDFSCYCLTTTIL